MTYLFFAFLAQMGICLVNASGLNRLPHVPHSSKSIFLTIYSSLSELIKNIIFSRFGTIWSTCSLLTKLLRQKETIKTFSTQLSFFVHSQVESLWSTEIDKFLKLDQIKGLYSDAIQISQINANYKIWILMQHITV